MVKFFIHHGLKEFIPTLHDKLFNLINYSKFYGNVHCFISNSWQRFIVKPANSLSESNEVFIVKSLMTPRLDLVNILTIKRGLFHPFHLTGDLLLLEQPYDL